MEPAPQSYFAVVGRRWKPLAIICLVPTILAVILVMFILKPVFEARASVVFPLKRSSSFMRRSLQEMDIPVGIMSGIMDSSPTLYNHISIIESRSLAMRVNQYLLDEKDIDMLATYPDILDDPEYETDEERLRALAERMQKRIRVEDADRGLAEIVFLHNRPRVATEVANGYVTMTLRFLNEINQSSQADLRAFLELRQVEVRESLEYAENEIMLVKTETGIIAVEGTAEQIIRSYAEIEALVVQAEIESQGSRTRAHAMASAGYDMEQYYLWLDEGNVPEGDPPVPLIEALADSTIATLRSDLAGLELQRQQTLLWATRENPEILAIELQIEAVRRELYREISDYSDAAVAQFMVESTVFNAQLSVAEMMLGELDRRLDEFPPQERRIIELERDRQVYEAIYMVITQELEQARIQELREEKPFTVLDEALVPTKPVKPRKLVIIIGTFAISFWIGILVIFSADARSRRTVESGG